MLASQIFHVIYFFINETSLRPTRTRGRHVSRFCGTDPSGDPAGAEIGRTQRFGHCRATRFQSGQHFQTAQTAARSRPRHAPQAINSSPLRDLGTHGVQSLLAGLRQTEPRHAKNFEVEVLVFCHIALLGRFSKFRNQNLRHIGNLLTRLHQGADIARPAII